MNNAIELEKKFLLTQENAFLIIKNNNLDGCKYYVKSIEQHYLFKENSEIFYDVELNSWNITLKHNGFSEKFIVKETKNALLAKELFSKYSGKDLIDIKCAARIRIDNNKPVFTFKIPIENSYGDYEFEHDIQDSIKNLIYFDSFIKNDPFVVKKERHTIYVTPFYYEIDFFLNLDLSIQNKELDISMLKGEKLCVLEIEFKSLLEYNHFKPDFEAINVTKTRGFSNRMMARKIGLDKN